METVQSPQAVATIAELSKRGLTIAAAESLTAGMLCASLAAVPGASAVLRGGLVVYATDLKHRLAGVSAATLQKVGPVAEDTAVELAEGARRACQADIGIGLTGVAGPATQGGHPVGTVFIVVWLCRMDRSTFASVIFGEAGRTFDSKVSISLWVWCVIFSVNMHNTK